MRRAAFARRLRRFSMALVAIVAIASPSYAQTTGILRGQVLDTQGQPIEGATVIIQSAGASKLETKTNKKGEFSQIGLPPGMYKVTAEKGNLGAQSLDIRVRLGSTSVRFILGGEGTEMSREQEAQSAEVKKLFEEGVTASNANNHDEAIAKFSKAIEVMPTCADCYYNLGVAYSDKKEYDEAEPPLKKAIELRPTHADAYTALANIYNSQKRFEDAAAMSAKASELTGGITGTAGGNVAAIYNQGVILWNGGKTAEAKKLFEQAVQIDPNHAEAHYWLGMANVNQGDMAAAATEFETYLKLAPTGQYAEQAKGILAAVKK